jgi:2-oxoisovalerate dehydrogenase E2 component (dihydrolipoyl transacylase)
VLALGGAVGQVMAVGAELVRLEVEGAGNLKEKPKGKQLLFRLAPSRPAPTPRGRPRPAAAAVRPPAAPPPAVCRKPGERPLASPAVRRRALDMGIDLRRVHGSGPAGRIEHDDLDALPPAAGRAAGGSPYVERHGEEAIPVIGLRRKIAQKMQDAKRRIPHFSYVEEVDVTELEALRQQLNKIHGATRGKLTLLPFLVRAMVLALRDFPQINARYDDDAGVVTRHGACTWASPRRPTAA